MRWLTIEPERGRQDEPAWRSNCSAAWSRKNSMAVAALDQRLTFGGEAFEFDRSDLRAILFLLAALLRLLVVVEFALDPFDGTVEEIDRRPEQILEVGFEASIAQGDDERVEDVGDGACDSLGFGQRSQVGLVLEGAIAIELEFSRGRDRSEMRCAAARCRCRHVRSSWGASLRPIDRAHRGLHGDERRQADRTCTRSEAKGRSVSGGWRRPAILFRDVKAALTADGK